MSELFIQRPITTTLIMAGIVLFGFIGYRALPVSDLPNVDYPTIQVTAELPGGITPTLSRRERGKRCNPHARGRFP